MVRKEAKKVVLKDAEGNYIVPVIDPADRGGSGGLEVCDIGMALYVDETKGLRRYLNGQIVDINTNTQAFLNRLQEITTLHPSLLCTENEWQTAKTNSAFGQVGKFVFNYSGEEIVSVRLPRVVNVQGLFDLQNLGMTVEAGLPNITGEIDSIRYCYATKNATGAFASSTEFNASLQNFWENKKNSDTGKLKFNANNSNSIYGNSDTIQEEAIQYPYFIQIATGSETENNIINDIELNNPYSLFDSKYSGHELNNLSWLKSNGQWNPKATYPTAYDKLLKVYNGTETVEGLSVKLSTETYTDYDFVLNTANETFRLPILTKDRVVVETKTVASTTENDSAISYTYTLYNDGWLEYNGRFSLTVSSTVILPIAFADTKYNIQITDGGSARINYGYEILNTSTFRICGSNVNQVGSWYACGYTIKPQNTNLYFYVGETVQNANLIDAGRIGEQLATKVDILQASGAGMPSDKYIDLTLGASGSTYVAPANGWLYLAKETSQSGIYVIKPNTNETLYAVDSGVITPNSVPKLLCPMLKGQTCKVGYTGTGVTQGFRFFYAEGSESEV